MSDEPKVKPLQSRTMTLRELQLATLDLIRKMRFQLNRAAHEDGMSDTEFADQILEPMTMKIYADIEVLKMHRQQKAEGRAKQ